MRFFFSDSESLLPFGGGDLQASLGGRWPAASARARLNFPFDMPVTRAVFEHRRDAPVFANAGERIPLRLRAHQQQPEQHAAGDDRLTWGSIVRPTA